MLQPILKEEPLPFTPPPPNTKAEGFFSWVYSTTAGASNNRVFTTGLKWYETSEIKQIIIELPVEQLLKHGQRPVAEAFSYPRVQLNLQRSWHNMIFFHLIASHFDTDVLKH